MPIEWFDEDRWDYDEEKTEVPVQCDASHYNDDDEAQAEWDRENTEAAMTW